MGRRAPQRTLRGEDRASLVEGAGSSRRTAQRLQTLRLVGGSHGFRKEAATSWRSFLGSHAALGLSGAQPGDTTGSRFPPPGSTAVSPEPGRPTQEDPSHGDALGHRPLHRELTGMLWELTEIEGTVLEYCRKHLRSWHQSGLLKGLDRLEKSPPQPLSRRDNEPAVDSPSLRSRPPQEACSVHVQFRAFLPGCRAQSTLARAGQRHVGAPGASWGIPRKCMRRPRNREGGQRSGVAPKTSVSSLSCPNDRAAIGSGPDPGPTARQGGSWPRTPLVRWVLCHPELTAGSRGRAAG